ncbi:MAG TPA: FkbM family methyltransferase [Bryobacteraceae bacterium]|nr:FkbM family methyltransferase [Bryobacteraceae bacterium]
MPELDANDDILIQHYSLKHRTIAWISSHLFDHITYTVQHGLLKGMKRRGGLGWLPASLTSSEVTAEERFWHDLDLRGKTVYDIGAFHGLLTLFFAGRAKSVVSFEPNSRNRARLLENLRLNKIQNVQVRDRGVGSQRESRQMASVALTPGGASIDERAIESFAKSGAATVTEDVSIVTLDEEIPEQNLPRPDFIKIDTEGWELEALRGARNTLLTCSPALFLEMHGSTMGEKKRKVSEIVNFLRESGYRQIVHVESGEMIHPENSGIAARGHLYCSGK